MSVIGSVLMLMLLTVVADGTPAVQYRILVKKSERKLYLYRIENGKETLAKTYNIALGNTPGARRFADLSGFPTENLLTAPVGRLLRVRALNIVVLPLFGNPIMPNRMYLCSARN